MSLVKNTYYIGAGFENKMYTLRQYIQFENTSGNIGESDRYIKNLSTNYDEAYVKAVKYAKEDNVTLVASLIDELDPIIRKTPEYFEKLAEDLQIKIDDFLEANPVLAQHFTTYGDADTEVQRDIGFAFYDIKDKLYKYGNLSEAQVDFCLKMVDNYITRKENAKVWAEE